MFKKKKQRRRFSSLKMYIVSCKYIQIKFNVYKKVFFVGGGRYALFDIMKVFYAPTRAILYNFKYIYILHFNQDYIYMYVSQYNT